MEDCQANTTVSQFFEKGIQTSTLSSRTKQLRTNEPQHAQGNDTLVRHGALYDEIDSVYYIPATGSIRTDPNIGNTPLEIKLSTPNNGRNFENTVTGNFVNRNPNDKFASGEIKPCISTEHVSTRSSEDESYLATCRKYINLEIFGNGEKHEHEREQ
ncbi:unnamed protein product [Mytilus coruscus]|uniref:Uncharacterized protein n=1 Tax=Mytilus coruscus TaxID=42192 RepID=A0A6J8EXX8_MYTCO|nr:unnamed protein product [Mytilus coruscus]